MIRLYALNISFTFVNKKKDFEDSIGYSRNIFSIEDNIVEKSINT